MESKKDVPGPLKLFYFNLTVSILLAVAVGILSFRTRSLKLAVQDSDVQLALANHQLEGLKEQILITEDIFSEITSLRRDLAARQTTNTVLGDSSAPDDTQAVIDAALESLESQYDLYEESDGTATLNPLWSTTPAYKEPLSSSPITNHLTDTQTYPVISSQGDWVNLKLNNTSGWVQKQFLDLSSP